MAKRFVTDPPVDDGLLFWLWLENNLIAATDKERKDDICRIQPKPAGENRR